MECPNNVSTFLYCTLSVMDQVPSVSRSKGSKVNDTDVSRSPDDVTVVPLEESENIQEGVKMDHLDVIEIYMNVEKFIPRS